jgi:hypothetical protein
VSEIGETPEPIERVHSEAAAEGEEQSDAGADGDHASVQAPSNSRIHAQEPAEGA